MADAYNEINKLFDELGTAASYRRELVQEISDLEEELAALDRMADDAGTREEYDEIMRARKGAELDIKFARNRLRRFDQSPRIDPEVLTDLLNQLSAEADAAAHAYRQRVGGPLAEIVTAGDEFDAAIDTVLKAVRKMVAINGRVVETDSALRRQFSRFELGALRSRAFEDDGRIVHPGFRDALRLAATARQPTFDTH